MKYFVECILETRDCLSLLDLILSLYHHLIPCSPRSLSSSQLVSPTLPSQISTVQRCYHWKCRSTTDTHLLQFLHHSNVQRSTTYQSQLIREAFKKNLKQGGRGPPKHENFPQFQLEGDYMEIVIYVV